MRKSKYKILAMAYAKDMVVQYSKPYKTKQSLSQSILINPKSAKKILFDYFIYVVLFISFILTPYNIAFHMETLLNYKPMRFMEFSIDCILCLNMILNFFENFKINKKWNTSVRKTVKRYLLKGFILDAFSIIPGIITRENSYINLYYLKLIRFMFLPTIYKEINNTMMALRKRYFYNSFQAFNSIYRSF